MLTMQYKQTYFNLLALFFKIEKKNKIKIKIKIKKNLSINAVL